MIIRAISWLRIAGLIVGQFVELVNEPVNLLFELEGAGVQGFTLGGEDLVN